MKKEEACRRIDNLDYYLQHYTPPDYSDRDHEAMMMAKKALEQESIIDKVKQAREEIQKLVDMCGSDTVADLNMKSGLGLALEKIDKLIESEI